MSLRVTRGPDLSTRSAKVGDVVEVSLKVENAAAAPASVSLYVEGLEEGALARPVELPVLFDPPAARVPAKGRASLVFSWRAALPEDRDKLTLRGRLALKETDSGRLVAEVPLDLYVSR